MVDLCLCTEPERMTETPDDDARCAYCAGRIALTHGKYDPDDDSTKTPENGYGEL